MMSLPV